MNCFSKKTQAFLWVFLFFLWFSFVSPGIFFFPHAMCFPKNLPPKSPGVEAVLHGGLEPDDNRATRDPWKPPERTIQKPIEIWR